MRPDYRLEDELTSKDRAILADTPLVRFGVGPSTLEKPLGTEFKLPIGLVAYSSTLLRTYFGAANSDPDTGSLAAVCDIYLLPDTKPEHFAVLADYILRGHGTLKPNLGKSTLATVTAEPDGNERIYNAMNIDTGIPKATDNVRRNESLYQVLAGTGSLTDDAVQHLMPQALMLLDAAEEVNTFISLCDKLEMNRAIWTAIPSFDLIIRFAIVHSIPLFSSSDTMTLWGLLGDVLAVKNEEVRKMMPKEVFDVWRGVVGAAYGRRMLMGGVIDEDANLYSRVGWQRVDSTVDQVGVAMK